MVRKLFRRMIGRRGKQEWKNKKDNWDILSNILRILKHSETKIMESANGNCWHIIHMIIRINKNSCKQEWKDNKDNQDILSNILTIVKHSETKRRESANGKLFRRMIGRSWEHSSAFSWRCSSGQLRSVNENSKEEIQIYKKVHVQFNSECKWKFTSACGQLSSSSWWKTWLPYIMLDGVGNMKSLSVGQMSCQPFDVLYLYTDSISDLSMDPI